MSQVLFKMFMKNKKRKQYERSVKLPPKSKQDYLQTLKAQFSIFYGKQKPRKGTTNLNNKRTAGVLTIPDFELSYIVVDFVSSHFTRLEAGGNGNRVIRSGLREGVLAEMTGMEGALGEWCRNIV